PPTNWSRREHGAALHRLQLVRTPLDSTCYECQQERKDSRSSAVTILPNTHTHTHTHTMSLSLSLSLSQTQKSPHIAIVINNNSANFRIRRAKNPRRQQNPPTTRRTQPPDSLPNCPKRRQPRPSKRH